MARVIVHDRPILWGPNGGISFEAVDIRKVNFNKMWANTVSNTFNDNTFGTWNGITYQDNWQIDSTIGSTSYSTILYGKNIVINGSLLITSGQLQAFVDFRYSGPIGGNITTLDPKVTVDRFAISAKTFDQAATTPNTTDDKAVMKMILSGNDVIKLSTFADFYRGYNGNDRMFGKSGNDKLFGDAGRDRIDGGDGSDKISGGNGNDTMLGRKGNDVLAGNKGADRFFGHAGKDKMYAGVDAQKDTFIFTAVSDSKVGAKRDMIYQFQSGEDKIDLSKIDANTSVAGDQSFGVNGTTAAANSIWLSVSGANAVVNGDVNGDAKADFQIEVVGVLGFTGSDFIL